MKYFINTNRKIYILSTLAILLFTCCQNGKTKKENEEADSIEYVSALTEISEALGQQQLFEPGTASFNGYVVLAKQAAPISEQEAVRLTTQFMNEHMLDVCNKASLPYYKKYMSLEDINALRDFYKSDRGARIANAGRQYYSPDIQAYIQSQVTELVMMYLQGESPSQAQHTQSVAYEEAFDRVVKSSDLSTVIDNFSKFAGANLSSKDKRLYDKCIKNIRKDIITISGEIFARYLSIEDTKALADWWESSLGQKAKKVNIECTENALEMGNIILKEFQTWIKKATSSRIDQKNNQKNGHKAVDLGLSVN